MYKQLSLTDLIAAIQSRINQNCDIVCYDYVPKDTRAPFCFVEVVSVKPADTKTMYMKEYETLIHIIAKEDKSSVPMYKYIQSIQEAMTEDIKIPSYVRLVLQTDAGVQAIMTDETGEKHAILNFKFKIAYGYKIKK